jgi:hypothetical protein
MPDTHYDLNSSGVGGYGGGFGGGWGGGFGGFGLFGLIGLLGRRGFGGDDCDGGNRHADCHEAIFNSTVLSKLGTLEAAIPLATAAINANTTAAAVSVKDNIQNQTLFQSQAFSSLALAGQQGMANLKDSVQAGAAITNASIGNLKDTVQIGIAAQGADARELANLINQQTCAIQQMIGVDGGLTRTLINAIERDRLRDELDEERHGRRSKDVEINMSQQMTNIQAQAQAQQQQQQQWQRQNDAFNHLACRLGAIEQFQAARFSTGAFNFGAGTVTQTPTNTQNQVGSV